MIHIGLKIKQLAEQRNFSPAKLSEILGYKSRKASYDLFDKEDVNTEILQKLSDYCEIPVTYFFEDTEKVTIPSIEKVNKSSFNNNMEDELRATIDILKQQNDFLQDLVKSSFQGLANGFQKLSSEIADLKKHSGVKNIIGERASNC